MSTTAEDRQRNRSRGSPGWKVIVVVPILGSCSGDPHAYAGWAHSSFSGHDFETYGCLVLPTLEEVQARH